MLKGRKHLAASLVLGSVLLVLFPATGLAAPTCSPVKDNGDLERATKEILGMNEPPGGQDIARATRYPRFNLSVASRGRGQAKLNVTARSFRAPAGLYGSPLIQMRKFARMAIQNNCQAVISLMPVHRVRRCAPTFSPKKGVHSVCRTRWWPLRGKNCQSNGSGSYLCDWLTRRFKLGEPVRVHLPQGKNKGVRVYAEVADYIIPGECICDVDGVPAQGSGRTNEFLLR